MDELDALGKVLRSSRALKPYEQSYPDLEARLRAAYDAGDPWVTKAAQAMATALDRQAKRGADWYIETFRLTATEARLTAFIVAGGTVASYATTHGVALSTARTQLKSVFLKVGVNRQTALLTKLRGKQDRL